MDKIGYRCNHGDKDILKYPILDRKRGTLI